MQTASHRSVLQTLPLERIVDIARQLGVGLRAEQSPSQALDLATLLEGSQRISFSDLLGLLQRDELRQLCVAHGLDAESRSRPVLIQTLLRAHGDEKSIPPKPLFSRSNESRFDPKPGDTVRLRHRQWLVGQVHKPDDPAQATRLKLTCLDDDHRGAELEVLWELELGAEVIHPESQLPETISALDSPQHFAAYYNTLRWQGVSATEVDRFQAPFRAGIKIQPYQLTPLSKALSLPRANLFIADDVGLGKTIEAGLVAQELLLRQRVDFILVSAPASLLLQWQDEMNKRFGLRFEVFCRDYILKKRRERGFAINPWATHHRFIISYPLLRRPEYRDPLLQHIGERAHKSLLILDEAHTVAPASASKYAVDSAVTKVVRDIAPRFENRLFLSATPHNGHSNSFSALLEILDPQRFSRAVPVQGPQELAPVMVRRLKSDLREIMPGQKFSERKIIRVALEDKQGSPQIQFADSEPMLFSADESLADPAAELKLAELLRTYTEIHKRAGVGQAKRLSLINLQKRLLSSPEAFARTLELHDTHQKRALKKHELTVDAADLLRSGDAETAQGIDEQSSEELYDRGLEGKAALEQSPNQNLLEQSAALRAEMLGLARVLRRKPDMKALAIIAWLKRHCCHEIGKNYANFGKLTSENQDKKWSDRRVIIFTEYADSKRYLRTLLQSAFEGTERGDERLLEIHGGMSDEAREQTQYAFNTKPADHPVRVLLCTDAAREGLNLQAFCADLFHYDIPWNPSRMEQRNGRIDRQQQPSPEVRCHYFIYPERKEDRVLQTLVSKTETIRSELGSLGTVVLERMEQSLQQGIDEQSEQQLALSGDLGEAQNTTRRELEAARELKALRKEVDEANGIFERSRKALDFRGAELRAALNVGLSFSDIPPLEEKASGVFELPEFPRGWQETLDTLRPPRARDQSFYEHRAISPRPVVFEAPDTMSQDQVHLHLEHPFVKRVLSRFSAQGHAVHDLSRVSLIAMPDTAQAHVLVLGRLSLFGSGAGRLHDTLLAVAASFTQSEGLHLPALDPAGTETLISAMRRALGRQTQAPKLQPLFSQKLCNEAPALFRKLWPLLKDEADAEALAAEQKLSARAAREAEMLRGILLRQKSAIEEALGGKQTHFDFGDSQSEKQQAEQRAQDLAHLRRRLGALEIELEHEPKELAAIYDVKLHRLEPVGLVYLWPELEL
ncbi:MAG: DEAD/DEAH box helicase [Myxococcales bacterium]|nr:MAG: DEAD/DEAH box helicase [Myxococcales bacterium]